MRNRCFSSARQADAENFGLTEKDAGALRSFVGPIGPLKHLAKEAVEAQEAPDDLSEYADCFMLIIDAARRAGFGLEQLTIAAVVKLAKNKLRKWSVPLPDEAVHHVRENDPTAACENDTHSL